MAKKKKKSFLVYYTEQKQKGPIKRAKMIVVLVHGDSVAEAKKEGERLLKETYPDCEVVGGRRVPRAKD